MYVLVNVVCVVLEVVVHARGERVDAVRDHVVDLNLQLLFGQVEMESVAQRAHYARSALLKAGQLRAELHDLHDGHELVHVLARRQEALEHQNLEVGEHVALLAAHHLHKLVCHLM